MTCLKSSPTPPSVTTVDRHHAPPPVTEWRLRAHTPCFALSLRADAEYLIMSVNPTVELAFDLTDVLRLAEDAAAATHRRTRWEPGPTDRHPGHQVDAGSCLMLVRDDGVYLMSTNAAQDRVHHTYAYGFHPDHNDWWNRWLESGLPGDDFVEYLDLVESGLLADLRRALASGYERMVITLTEESLRIAFEAGSAQRPPQPS